MIPTLASDTAMVMAAGLGKRMRPLTDIVPKPLVQVQGKPLIDHTLDQLADEGIEHAVVNVHYLPDVLEAHLAKRVHPRVTVSDEREQLLETGGGLVKARHLLPDPFFCLNSDNIWRNGAKSALQLLSDQWDAARMDVLLLVVEHERAIGFNGEGDFLLDSAGHLERRPRDQDAPFIYTGIQLVSHRLLRDPPSGAFSTNLLWNRALEERRLFGVAFTGLWFEVGTPEAVRNVEEALTSV